MPKATNFDRSAAFFLTVALALFFGNQATAQNLLTNGGCESGGDPPSAWFEDDGADDWRCATSATIPGIDPADGVYYFLQNGTNPSNVNYSFRQVINVSADAAAIDAGTEGLDFSAKYRDDTGNSIDQTSFSVRFYNAGFVSINGGADNWTSSTITGNATYAYQTIANAGIPIPVGTRNIEVYFDCRDVDLSAYCDYTYDTFSLEYATPLPVELTDFRAVVNGNAAIVTWTTAAEFGNTGFEVEQAGADARWTRVAFSPSAGGETHGASYEYRTGQLAAGVYQFRLKQINSDGSFNYSPVVEAAVAGSALVMFDKPYPNPFTTTTRVTLSVPTEQRVTVAAYNIIGKEIAILHNGVITANTPTHVDFDGRDLPNGLYMIRAVGATFSSTQTVVLQK